MFKLRILFLFIIVSCVCQCAPQPTRICITDGNEYKISIFDDKWWNYYERGLSFAKKECFKEAIADFEEAIKQRDKDQRKALTYGVNFIDYFPHRELGIIYYQIGNLEQAKKELELSHSQFPSAKASFFLDHIRSGKNLIKKKTEPKITLDLKELEFWTRDDSMFLSGEAEDEQYITSINIGGKPLYLKSSKKHIRFKEQLTLKQGKNVIGVEAKNLEGKSATYQVVIHLDQEGPVITVDNLISNQNADKTEIIITGHLYDKAGVSEFFINKQKIPIQQGIKVLFTKKLTVKTDKLELTARDSLGNETSAQFSLPFSSSRESVLLASANLFLAYNSVNHKKQHPPNIQIKGAWKDTQKVSWEKVYIGVQVTDDKKIRWLAFKIKNQTSDETEIPIARPQSQMIAFGRMIELQKGENIITVEATDEDNNTATKTISFVRTESAPLIGDRLIVSVNQNDKDSKTNSLFKSNLCAAFLQQERFRIFDKNKYSDSNIKVTITEDRFSGIEIAGQMIDTETSEILAEVDVYDLDKDPSTLRALAWEMAFKFEKEFPLLIGNILLVKDNHVFTDILHNMLKPQRKLTIFREEKLLDPDSGKEIGIDYKIIGHAQVIGYAKITGVSEKVPKAEILNTTSVNKSDKVITQ